MIPIEKRREIYIKHFIELNSERKISKELNISRNTVSKILSEYRLALKKHNLINEDDLSKYIDLIVVKPKIKRTVVEGYKAKQYHIDIVKKLVDNNEKKRTRIGKCKTNLELFNDFKSEIVYDEDNQISYSTFYNLVKKVKKITY
ncbi:MAG: hypothetical protein ACLUG9_12720 [Paraclostridium sordellii]